MPKYQLPNAQTTFEYFTGINNDLKNAFIAYGKPDEDLKLLQPLKKTTVFYSSIEDVASMEQAKSVHFTKKIIYTKKINNSTSHTPATHSLAIINQNGVFDTLAWTTTPSHIRTAVRSGLFSPKSFQNHITEMIAQLGEYKRWVFKQSVEEKSIVKRNANKLAIVDFTQDCLESFLPLYYSINNYDNALSPQDNLKNIVVKLDQLITKFSKYKNVNAPLLQMTYYHFQLTSRLKNTAQPLTESEVQNLLRPYANPFAKSELSLQHFIQAQLNNIINKAMQDNYVVSGFLGDSSKLQKIIVKTQIISDRFSTHKVDYHNPYTPAHGLDFSGQANAEGLVTVDLANFGLVPKTKAELAEQIALIERIDSKKKLYSKTDQERGFFGINWYGNVFSGATWLVNFGKDILGTILDLGYIFGKSLNDGVEYYKGRPTQPAQFPSSYNWMLKKDLAESKYAALPVNAPLYDTEQPIKMPHYNILEGLYVGVARIFSSLLIEPLVSVSNIVADEVWRLKTVRQIFYDATISTAPISETGVALLVSQRLNEMKVNAASNAVTQVALLESYNQMSGHAHVNSYDSVAGQFSSRKNSMPPAAKIPYSLTPDNPADLVNWLIDDFIRGLFEVFSHSSLRDHPIAGLALTLGASSAAPMIIPALLRNPVLGAINHQVSVPIAKFLIGDTSGVLAGVSTGLLQGQMCFLAADIFNGRNSIAVDGLKTLLENPVIATVVTMAAVGFGYALAYEMQIPYLSALIVSETDQATFPWFELGIAGAKIAAVLIEGTLNLHGDHQQSGNYLADDVIKKLKPEIKSAIQKTYCYANRINEADLVASQQLVIADLVESYCAKLNNALQKPHIAQQINKLSTTIGAMLGNENQIDLATQNALMMYLERREVAHQITQLNPRMLTTRDKYIIINYVNQVYPNDPSYVAAVRNHLENETQMGPLGETFKIIFNYPAAIMRSTIAGARSLGYQFIKYYYQLRAEQDKANAIAVVDNHAWQPVRDLGRKIRNDLGLLVKGIASTLRITWDLVAAIVMVPVTLLLWLPAMMFYTNAPIKIFTGFNRFAFAPGRISQFINFIVGTLREDVTSKKLALATHNIDVRHGKIVFTGNSEPLVKPRTGNLTAISPELEVTQLEGISLEMKVIELITVAFNSRITLSRFVTVQPDSINKLFENLTQAITHGEPLENLHMIVNRSKPQFNRELKAALLEVLNTVKQIPQITSTDKLAYQQNFTDLFQINRREPIVEFVNAYKEFIAVPLAELSVAPELQHIHATLVRAQAALKQLQQPRSDNKSSQQLVIDCLQENDFLSLRSIHNIEALKKIIGDAPFISTAKKKTDETLLRALEIIHNSANNAAFRLAAYPAIVNKLTQLPSDHVLAAVDKAAIVLDMPIAVASLSSPVTAQSSRPQSYYTRA
jgi:hypothetical protein